MNIRYILISAFLLSMLSSAIGQTTFSFEGQELLVTERIKISSAIIHDDAIILSDGDEILLFKQYFNPSSFEVFKSFFLREDWGGFTKAEFDQWQSHIRSKKLHLENIFHLQDPSGGQFLVFQYTMESPEYSISQSTEFKMSSTGWKHTSLQNDRIAHFLAVIGAMDTEYFEQQEKNKVSTINLNVLQSNQVRTYKEKFNRNEVVLKVTEVLKTESFTPEDIEHAQTLFLSRDDNGMIDYLATKYKVDDIHLMKLTNEKCGFSLFNYVRAKETN